MAPLSRWRSGATAMEDGEGPMLEGGWMTGGGDIRWFWRRGRAWLGRGSGWERRERLSELSGAWRLGMGWETDVRVEGRSGV